MKKCQFCKNSIRNTAVYCDNCGKLLKNYIEINYDKNFNELLLDLSKTIKKNNEGWYENNSRVETLIDLFWYYMFKHSDILKVLNNEKISLKQIEFSFPRDICYELKKSSNENIFKNFIKKFNEKFIQLISELSISKYTFYFLTNIDEKNIEELKELCGLFDLDLLSYRNLYQNENFHNEYKYLNNLKELLIIKKVIEGKDTSYLNNILVENIHSLFGLLTIMEFYNKRIITSYSNQFDIKHNLINYKILKSEIYYETDDEIEYDNSYENKYLFELFVFKKKYKYGKNLIVNNNYIEKIKKINKNKKIFNKLTEYLSLYYEASIDETLDGSFIKYWTLTEKILKNMLGNMNSDKLMSYRKKIMKQYYNYPLVDRLDELREKRNKYVHELKNDINQSDCNLIRLVSENLIVFIFSEFDKVDKFTDYGILLEFTNQEQKIKDIKKFIEKDYF